MNKKLWSKSKDYIYPDSYVPSFRSKQAPLVKFVEFYISDQCQLNCAHCFHGTKQAIKKQLSFSEWCAVIDQFVKLGVKHFHIAGGEPFINDKSLQVMQYLDSKKNTHNIKYGCITNGLSINKYISLINDLNIDYIDFSIDGLKKGHESLRGEDTFEKTIENLILTMEHVGTDKLYVSSAVCSLNYSEIPDMLEWLSTAGVTRFFVQPIRPMGKALFLKTLLLSSYDYAQLIDMFTDKIDKISSSRNRIGLIIAVPPSMLENVCSQSNTAINALDAYLSNDEAIVKLKFSLIKFHFGLRCSAFDGSCIITSDGYYIGSCEAKSFQNYPDYSVGNVKNNSLLELMEKSVDCGTDLWQRVQNTLNSQIKI